ncbi:CRISPR system precrRNA processing endoribonuclease RAMP protein Cas6 [Spirulina major]|uniref:CRISPR system precrRNA processing endoribonuclease RAMP protein Cas6 n=1 Tax=Spirulina major TaxID=270636 RepID=UPI0009FE1B62|nr:CRISPR system precrRNA processing endoribonuclease RAMP protein Cas6 [Spirulina major]
MMYGLNLTLLPAPHLTAAQSLGDWLPAHGVTPRLLPWLAPQGVVKVAVVLPDPVGYGLLLPEMMAQVLAGGAVQWRGQTYTVGGIEQIVAPLQTLSIRITARDPFPKDVNRACHALVLDWVRQANPDLSAALHNGARSPFRLNTRLDGQKRNLYLYISLWQGELLAPLLWGLQAQLGQGLTVTKLPCCLDTHVKSVYQGTWEGLAATEPSAALKFQLFSPTSFKQGGVVQPFPLPDVVFRGLWQRWNAFAPAAVQLPAVEWSGMVAAYDLKTVPLYLNGVTEIGATGWIIYQFRDPEQAAIASILASFATLVGIGRKTPWGMGHVAWQPPTQP